MIFQPARNWTGVTGAPAAAAPPLRLESTRNDPLNMMVLYLGLGTVFIQFSVLPQVLGYLLQAPTYLLYVVTLPAILAMIASGGLRRCFRGRPAYYWVAFGCWMWAAVPFSTWPGAAFNSCFEYWRSNLMMLFLVGAMVEEWKDVRKVMNVVAAAAVVNILCSRFLQMDAGERMGVALGSIGNPNDYAAHLILVLPFLLWVVLSGKAILRIAALGFIGFGLYAVLATSSRGALLALAVDVVAWLLLGSGRQKIALAVIVPIAAMALVATIPASSSRRLMAIWLSSAKSAESAEAMESSNAREYTLRTSIRYTFQYPVFGVGPQQFSLYEGSNERTAGTHGYWHDTHNSFTQASSECGIPGFIFFAGGILSTVLLLLKTLREARKRPDCKDIATAVFCLMLGMIGFTVAITFLNFAYFFYFPTMAGLAIGVWGAAKREFELRDAAWNATAA